MMTPSQIGALLAIHCYPEQFVFPYAIRELHDHGMILPKTVGDVTFGHGMTAWREPVALKAERFTLTARGKAMVQALLHLPLPQGETLIETTWAIPGTDFEFAESDL